MLVKTGDTDNASQVFTVKGKRLTVSTPMWGQENIVFNWGGAKTAYVDNNGKAKSEIKKTKWWL